MRTYFVFRSETAPLLRGFTDVATPTKLPVEEGPWVLVDEIGPEGDWTLDISRAVVAAGILENGFFLWGPINRPRIYHPVIGSDRVEGTAVVDSDGQQVGSIKRLLIEKTTGRVVDVDVTFGGFLGIGVQHRTIPWERLSYDREFEAYRTDMTEAQLRSAPVFEG